MSPLRCLCLVAAVVSGVVRGAPSEEPQSTSRPIPSFDIPSYPGPCPDLQVNSNYDIAKMMEGVWYQVYSTVGDKVHQTQSSKCIERRYTYTPEDSNLGVEKYSLVNRSPVWSNSNLIITNQSGVFLHSRDVGAWYHRVEIKALDADPDSHVLMWGCLYNENTNSHYESGGVSSRHRSLSEEKFQSIQNLLNSKNAAIEFEAVDWSDCRAKCN